MTTAPAPVLIALAVLILWPLAQIASLLLWRKRLPAVALEGVRHSISLLERSLLMRFAAIRPAPLKTMILLFVFAFILILTLPLVASNSDWIVAHWRRSMF